MHYPIAIKWGDKTTATGIYIPDIPGAVITRDNFEEAYNAAIEIAHIRLEKLFANGTPMPMPMSAIDYRCHPDYAGLDWGIIEIDTLHSPCKGTDCHSLDEIRERIDRADRKIVRLLAERGDYVTQAARFKNTPDEVKAPQRVEQVIAKVVALSEDFGENPFVIEQVYRAMIGAFIDQELNDHTNLQKTTLL